MIDALLAESMAEAQDSVEGMQAEIDSAVGTPSSKEGIDMLGDVDLDVTIELGRTEMLVEDVLRLASGSVVELNKLAGDPVDVYVNSRLVARGEVLVLNDNFCIRISEILADVSEAGSADAAEALLASSGQESGEVEA
jgi:flagellar motor switch protein FliN/FliY